MHKLPLRDELKYEFLEPRHHPLVMRLSKYYNARLLHRELKIHAVDTVGTDVLSKLMGRGDGILLAPNHSDHADSALMLDLGRDLGRPFYFMATHAIFRGVNRHVLPRLGCFPVDREGTDKRALRKAQEILIEGKAPLVIFPEGEIYRLNDKITPLREGVAAVATLAARKVQPKGRKIWVVPIGIKYRFMENADPLPWLNGMITNLEGRFEWAHDPTMPLVDRLYRYATGMLSLKEIEVYGNVRPGNVRERVTEMREHVLGTIEHAVGLRVTKSRGCTVPERVKECRRKILERLDAPDRNTQHEPMLKRYLDDLFFVIQLYSYPGDYVMSHPTCERAAEILIKFQQDALRKDLDRARHHVPRRATIHIGEPIEVQRFLDDAAVVASDAECTEAQVGKSSRRAMGALSDHLEARLQELLDRGSPGRPLPGFEDRFGQEP